MITQPTCGRLLETVREQLSTAIQPAVTDPALKGMLGMIDSVLQGVVTRCDNELAWMLEEIATIDAAAGIAVAAAPEGAPETAALAAGLAELRAQRNAEPDGIRADYARASEVLSKALDATVGQPGEAATVVRAALRQRLDREVEIRGPFLVVR